MTAILAVNVADSLNHGAGQISQLSTCRQLWPKCGTAVSAVYPTDSLSYNGRKYLSSHPYRHILPWRSRTAIVELSMCFFRYLHYQYYKPQRMKMTPQYTVRHRNLTTFILTCCRQHYVIVGRHWVGNSWRKRVIIRSRQAGESVVAIS